METDGRQHSGPGAIDATGFKAGRRASSGTQKQKINFQREKRCRNEVCDLKKSLSLA